jgi:hypothetical protein
VNNNEQKNNISNNSLNEKERNLIRFNTHILPSKNVNNLASFNTLNEEITPNVDNTSNKEEQSPSQLQNIRNDVDILNSTNSDYNVLNEEILTINDYNVSNQKLENSINSETTNVDVNKEIPKTFSNSDVNSIFDDKINDQNEERNFSQQDDDTYFPKFTNTGDLDIEDYFKRNLGNEELNSDDLANMLKQKEELIKFIVNKKKIRKENHHESKKKKMKCTKNKCTCGLEVHLDKSFFTLLK